MNSSNQNNQDITNNTFFTKESILTANTGKEVKNMLEYTTIKEISSLFKVNEITVRRAIKELFPDKIENGKTTYLNEIETAQIKDYILDNKRIDLGFKVEVKIEAEMYQKTFEVMSWLVNKNKELTEKADKYDTIQASENSMTMETVAKIIGFGRNNLFKYLRDKQILMRNNHPYQRFIDAGYFEVSEFVVKHNNGYIESKTQTYVTQKGVDYILSLTNSAKTKQLAEV